MKHVVFILGSYFPNFSAVGNCAEKVIKPLAPDYRITVLAIRGDLAHPARERVDGVDIVRVDTVQRRARLSMADASLSSGTGGKLRLLLHRLGGAAAKLFAPVTVERDLVDAYLRELDAMRGTIDVIVPLVFPFESVQAALQYKQRHPAVVVIPYLFDDFVESRSLHLLGLNRILKQRRHVSLERVMIEQADSVLAMHPLRAHFERQFSAQLLRKVHFLEHPLLAPHADATPQHTDGPVVVSYTGALIRKVREPDYLLQMLQAMHVDVPLQVDFYVMGNDAHKVKNVVTDTLRITNHGRVAQERARTAMTRSNVLLNLGEVRGKQVSSKVFEYMAAGKPIIHLAFVDNDNVSTILAKYPLALCLVQARGMLRINAQKCAQFIARHKHSQLGFDEVAAIYPEAIPSTTAALMRALFSEQNR